MKQEEIDYITGYDYFTIICLKRDVLRIYNVSDDKYRKMWTCMPSFVKQVKLLQHDTNKVECWLNALVL